tara:strand:+ start:7908 stop:8855 length:948 start_codon:yes stop_codon:yes gene_type:complete
MQLSRLYNILNHLKINTLDILTLSIFMIPNLINVILPFLLIFGLVLAFIKLSRDKEIIAIYSLGISIDEIKKPIFYLSILMVIFSLLISFFISPQTYAIYKEKEFNLRNTIQFDKIDFSNFIKFSDNLTIDFENNNGAFSNILISTKDEYETIIYGEKGEIEQLDSNLRFKLINGFKTQIKNDSIENLNFDSYIASFPISDKNVYKKNDINTLDFFEILNDRENNQYILLLRIIDVLIIIVLCSFYYKNNIKKNKFNLFNQLFFIITAIYCLLIDNLFEKYIINNNVFVLILFVNLFFVFFIPNIASTFRLIDEK